MNSALKTKAMVFIGIAAVSFVSVYKHPALAGKQGRPDPQVNSLDSWEGYFEIKSPRCSDPSNLGSCSSLYKDCLRIDRINDKYHVELYSVQAVQHICAFSFDMDVVGRMLVKRLDQSDRIEIHRSGGKLIITTNGFDPTALGAGLCGAHGDVNGLSFPISKKKRYSRTCFEGP